MLVAFTYLSFIFYSTSVYLSNFYFLDTKFFPFIISHSPFCMVLSNYLISFRSLYLCVINWWRKLYRSNLCILFQKWPAPFSFLSAIWICFLIHAQCLDTVSCMCICKSSSLMTFSLCQWNTAVLEVNTSRRKHM